MRRIVIALAALEILLVVGLASGELAMIPAARNPAVEPVEGNWNDSYNYSVELRFNDAISTELWVWDPVMSDFCPQGTAEYRDIGNWTRIYWHVSPFSGSAGYAGHDSKFKFRWNGTDLKEREEGMLRPLIGEGPRIKAIFTPPPPPTLKMFKDATVKPAYGHYNDSFTYSVFTQLNQTTNITLEVFDLSSYEWKEAGENQSYTETGNWQLLSWANVTNVSAVDCAGVASYRFLFFDAGERRESVVFYGPELDLYPTPTPRYSGGDGGGVGISPKEIVEDVKEQLLEDKDLQSKLAGKLRPLIVSGGGFAIKPPERINATVTPENGSWLDRFDYWVEVEHPNRFEMLLTLEVYCPGKGETHIISSREIKTGDYSETNRTTVKWLNVSVFSQEDTIASIKANESPQYYIRYNVGYNNGLSGPYPGPNLTNSPPVLSAPNVFPPEGTYNDLFVYKVYVSDKDGDDAWVTLHIVDPQGGWIYNKTHVVSGLDPKYLFCWENLPRSDSVRIKRFFTDDLNIKWAENATISKYNGNTINISTDNDTAVIVMDANKENATIKIGETGICTLEVKEENGKLKIYSKGNVTESWIYNGFKKKDADNEFKYCFTATDGINNAEKVEDKGPNIKSPPEREQALLRGLFRPIVITLLSIAIMASIALGLHYKRIIVSWWYRRKREIEEEFV